MMNETLRAHVVTGRGEATAFTDLDWVRRQLRDKLALEIHSGTLNLQPEGEEAERIWAVWRQLTGTELVPPQTGACGATCLPVRLDAAMVGAIIVPHVPEYPPDQIEVVAPVYLRTALRLRDGSTVTLQRVDPSA